MQRGIRDPARGGDRRRRTPELEQRKRAELVRELVAQLERLRVAVRQLAAVGLVDRPRRDADVVRGRHVVPPEQIGAGEGRVAPLARLPDLLAGDQPVRLPPQPDLHEVAEQPAVGDDAMVARQGAGHEGRLHAARHRRRHGRERPHRAGARKGAEPRRMRAEVARRQADDEQHERRTHVRFRPCVEQLPRFVIRLDGCRCSRFQI